MLKLKLFRLLHGAVVLAKPISIKGAIAVFTFALQAARFTIRRKRAGVNAHPRPAVPQIPCALMALTAGFTFAQPAAKFTNALSIASLTAGQP